MAKTSGNQKRFQPRDVLKQVMIQDLAVSPDETSVVYTRRTIEDGKYRSRLWRVSIEGGRPEQLTTSASFDSRPRFSPNGRTLLFLSDRSGKSQPWIMAFSGGEPRRAAEIDGDVSAAEWSPDGRRIALVAPSGEDRFITGKSSDPTARRITG
nr:PD40 domain-containing protein [Actinomycetota bacterium]